MGFFNWLFGDTPADEGNVEHTRSGHETPNEMNDAGYCPPGICTPSRVGRHTARQSRQQEPAQFPQVDHRYISVEEAQARHLLEQYHWDVRAIAKEFHPDKQPAHMPDLQRFNNDVMAEVNRIASEENRPGGFFKLR